MGILGESTMPKPEQKQSLSPDVEFALDFLLKWYGIKYRPDEDTEWVIFKPLFL